MGQRWESTSGNYMSISIDQAMTVKRGSATILVFEKSFCISGWCLKGNSLYS